jgi:3',5'-cyclic AMP phosphodiesterase CpdA
MKDEYRSYLAERAKYFDRVLRMDRRGFFEAAAAALATGKLSPHSFQPVEVVAGPSPAVSFTFAYLSDTHLFERKLNQRFVRAALRAIHDINTLDPQPDFVVFGGDLAQLGQPGELAEGAALLKTLRPKLYMTVGEHDWYFDLGDAWRKHFGKDVYSFDHKGVHFVVLNSILVEDYWTSPGMSPMERMLAMAQLDNPDSRPFQVGAEQRDWLAKDLASVSKETPIIVFSHSPLYKIYRRWNFWTDDAEAVQKILAPFRSVSVVHGHTHQMLSHKAGNIHFHGMLSTAWPWPYAPEGLPKLTVRMNRADPFDEFDGCGDGRVDVLEDGHLDKHYNLWSRKPIRVSARYLDSDGAADRPPRETDSNY